MTEERNRTIVIASILKPVDDTRMYEKIGETLTSLRDVSIHIIGFPSANKNVSSAIHFHPLKKFKRLSWGRFAARYSILRLCFKLKPSIFIITTHELLLTAVIIKIFTGCRVIYDVQENYFRNILYTDAFPLLLRPVLACWVRLKETFSTPFIDHFFLAEKGYPHEMKFFRKRYTVLENKLKKPQISLHRSSSLSEKNAINLLFTGTIAESSGIFEAIDLSCALHETDARIRLKIIGFAAKHSVLHAVYDRIKGHSFITLQGGDQLVPHHMIVEQILQADFGIISYPPNAATIHSIPTKLYEYLGLELPVLLTDHSDWASICAPYPAAVVFTPAHIDAASILSRMMSGRFFLIKPQDVFWESEIPKLIRISLQLLPAGSF
jgi:hypothetical protein